MTSIIYSNTGEKSQEVVLQWHGPPYR